MLTHLLRLKLSSIQTVMLMLTHFLKLRLKLTPTVMLMLRHFQMLMLSSIQTVMLMLTHFLKLRLNLTPTVMLMLMHFQMLKLSSTQTEMLKLMHFLKLRLNLTPTVMRSLKHLLRHFQEDFLKYSLKGMLMLPLIEKEKMRQPLTQMLKLMQILPYLLIQIETLLLKHFLRCFEMYLKMHSLYQLQTLTR